MAKPSRRTFRHDATVTRPSEKPPNVPSTVKRIRKRNHVRKDDKLSWRRYDAGSWYVIGDRNGQEYIISTHLNDNDASLAADCYRRNGLSYSNIRVEKHGQRGYGSKDAAQQSQRL